MCKHILYTCMYSILERPSELYKCVCVCKCTCILRHPICFHLFEEMSFSLLLSYIILNHLKKYFELFYLQVAVPLPEQTCTSSTPPNTWPLDACNVM